ncbi:MAG: GNAT family N-acetyltransferase [Anaerolineales bacterium]|nr:GNAT family N-acetyltransferase [Anaerolineales bacterium]
MLQERLALVEPTLELRDEFVKLVEEFHAAGEYYSHHGTAKRNFSLFLYEVESMAKGRNMPPGIVPMTTYWLVEDGTMVLGESRLRHNLTPSLRVEGGHIGYAIRPSVRNKGYGAQILALTLLKARALGLESVMVTCDTDNLPSARIIEKNGGVLSGQAVSPYSARQVSQYWIQLKK